MARERVEALIEWLRGEGAFVGAVGALVHGGEVGLRATAHLPEGALALTIPMSCIITTDDGRRTPLAACYELFYKARLPLPHFYLALWLLQEADRLRFDPLGPDGIGHDPPAPGPDDRPASPASDDERVPSIEESAEAAADVAAARPPGQGGIATAGPDLDADPGLAAYAQGRDLTAYYRSLPSVGRLGHLPLFWTAAELEPLRGSFVLRLLSERLSVLRRTYGQLSAAAPAFFPARASWQAFLWACSVVTSRNFFYEHEGEGRACLVPLLDLCNHLRPRRARWRHLPREAAFELRCERDHPEGEPLCDSYGARPNHVYLLSYGFAVESNTDYLGGCLDEAELGVALPEAAPPGVRQFWAEGAAQEDPHDLVWEERRPPGLGPRRMQRFSMRDDTALWELLSLARVSVADDALAAAWAQRGCAARDTVGTELNNEARALGLLKALAEERIAAFPTTLEEDERIMGTGELSPKARGAAIVLASEKRTLLWLGRFCAEAVASVEALLRGDEDGMERFEGCADVWRRRAADASGAYEDKVIGRYIARAMRRLAKRFAEPA